MCTPNLCIIITSGWALAIIGAASIGLQYELHVQKELTAPPLVFCQTNNDGRKSGRSSSGRSSGGGGGGVLNDKMDRIYSKLSGKKHHLNTGHQSSVNNQQKHQSSSNTNNNNLDKGRRSTSSEGILTRKIQPQLFIGTRGLMSSTAAYALSDKNRRSSSSINNGKPIHKTRRIREVMTMAADGALIVLDWEVPLDLDSNDDGMQSSSSSSSSTTIIDDIKQPNSITKPIILLLHGMNNDSSFGYIRSMMRTATDRGWIAVCMNFRGQDGGCGGDDETNNSHGTTNKGGSGVQKVKNNTPRGYNAGFTGDLRGVVQQIEYRLKRKSRTNGGDSSSSNTNHDHDEDDIYIGGPVFILGYSLGANVVTKYLGEESLHGTLPKCIGGGAAMGNPLHIHSGTIRFPWNMILGAGVKRSILQNISSFKQHSDPGFQHAMKKAMLASTIGKLDDAAAPYLARNDPYPPYTHRIGFKDGEEYWWDSSSHRYVAHVSVPLLKISAQDDFLVFGQFRKKLNYCLENPNVIVVKTRCGGHLGWQESAPVGSGSGSWSDVAVADFIEALLQVREEDECQKKKKWQSQLSLSSPKVLSRL